MNQSGTVQRRRPATIWCELEGKRSAKLWTDLTRNRGKISQHNLWFSSKYPYMSIYPSTHPSHILSDVSIKVYKNKMLSGNQEKRHYGNGQWWCSDASPTWVDCSQYKRLKINKKYMHNFSGHIVWGDLTHSNFCCVVKEQFPLTSLRTILGNSQTEGSTQWLHKRWAGMWGKSEKLCFPARKGKSKENLLHVA